jgi:hypothetical protein
MENIVESLFGLTPFQVQQQQNAGLNQAADHYASQDPFQRATGGMFRAGGMLGGAGAQAMGMVNPQMEQAKLTEAMMASGGDLSTSQGLMAKSQQFAAAGDQRTALKLALAGKVKQAEEAKAKLAQNKDDREELKMNRDAIWRHEETLARLEETSRANRAAAENTQLSREQRDIASRRADATDRLAIQMRADSQKAAADAKANQPAKLTQGQNAVDRKFGAEYADYQAGGGSADVEKQLKQLDQVATELSKKDNDYTGAAVGLIPDKARSFTNPEAVAAKNKVEEVAQRNLRLVLGAQFTQVEGERLIARAYNPQMKPEENARRVKALANQIRTAATVKEDAARYFEENGTLTGWKGRMPTLSDFDEAMNAVAKEPSNATTETTKYDGDKESRYQEWKRKQKP